jgi:hypothetical protein
MVFKHELVRIGHLTSMPIREQASWWTPWALALISTVGSLVLFVFTAAPGLTWEHQGADGGELLAAAVTNGVPHPPGYPLYIMLLRGWLAIGHWLAPDLDLARHGNLLSATCAALSAGVTTLVAYHLLPITVPRAIIALSAGLLWASTPLLWSQALITEVYALHALLVAFLGWAVLIQQGRSRYLIPVIAAGVAHHLTFVLLLPAVLYYLWTIHEEGADKKVPAGYGSVKRAITGIAVGVVLGLLFYGRTLVAASSNGAPPPVNWGYADNWDGFWWLVSGAAYRGYLFVGSSETALSRVPTWAYTLTSQLTPVGLALALLGLSVWDRNQTRLRNFSVLWVIPISIYAIGYYTRDSEIYLLPVTWLMTLWLAIGVAEALVLLAGRWRRIRWTPLLSVLLLGAIAASIILRWQAISVRNDQAARDFLSGSIAVLEPDSIIVSLADAETFALWYGVWGSGEILRTSPGVVPLNYSLYQFAWYQRLMQTLYPEVIGNHGSVEQILAANAGIRPIFFSEPLPYIPENHLTPAGPLWRYTP